MSIQLSQINRAQLDSYLSRKLSAMSVSDLSDFLGEVSNGGVLTFMGSPPSWQCVQLPDDPILTQDGLKMVVGSPPTKELLAVDETVVRTNTRNRLTLPVSGKFNAGIVFASGAPGFIFNEIGASKDEGVYRFYAQNGNLAFDVRNDANNQTRNWLHVSRNGMNVEIDFEGKQIRVNGEEVATKADIKELLDRVEALEDINN